MTAQRKLYLKTKLRAAVFRGDSADEVAVFLRTATGEAKRKAAGAAGAAAAAAAGAAAAAVEAHAGHVRAEHDKQGRALRGKAAAMAGAVRRGNAARTLALAKRFPMLNLGGAVRGVVTTAVGGSPASARVHMHTTTATATADGP
jgi:hypothetical protein